MKRPDGEDTEIKVSCFSDDFFLRKLQNVWEILTLKFRKYPFSLIFDYYYFDMEILLELIVTQ